MHESMDNPNECARNLIRAQRRVLGRGSLGAFARMYLGAHCHVTPSAMHREIFGLLETLTFRQRGGRLALAAPRGHAKSTLVSLAFVVWCICYKFEEFIVLISDTASQANDLLSHVKAELEANPRLLEDFPEVCEPPGSKPGPPRWRQDEIITRNGVRVSAFGAGKKLRGRRHRQHRPSLIILDDVENEEQVTSADRREKLANWLAKAVLKAGDRNTNAVVVGTVMHYDSLLATLLDREKSPGWTGHMYQAVCAWSNHPELWQRWENLYNFNETYEGAEGPDAARAFFEQHENEMLEGTQVLWPEREDYYTLMELRISEGVASFDSEKQNEPVNPADCLFREGDFHYWDDQYGTVEELIAARGGRGRVLFYGACDPSLGKPGRNRDDSAIITLLRDDKTGIMDVIDADIARRTPDQIISTIIEYQRLRDYETFGFECNQFQDYVADMLDDRSAQAGGYVPVRRIHNQGDKMGRIQKLQPLIKSGKIRFSRRHRTLLEQLRQFPKAAHDDGPDALEMAVNVARGGGGFGVCGLSADGEIWGRDGDDDLRDIDDDEEHDPLDFSKLDWNDERYWTELDW